MKFQNVNGRRDYEEEEKEWLRANYPHLGMHETAKQFNAKFNHNKNPKSLQRYCTQKLGLSVTEEYNQNKRYWFTAEIGTVSKNVRGEWKIKTEQGWIPLTRSMFDDIPEGHIVVHLACNKDNNEPENLIVLRNGIQTTLRNLGMWSTDARITETAIKWHELYEELTSIQSSNNHLYSSVIS